MKAILHGLNLNVRKNERRTLLVWRIRFSRDSGKYATLGKTVKKEAF